MDRSIGFLLVGLVVGAALGAVLVVLVSGGEDTEKLRSEIEGLRADVDRDRRELARTAEERDAARRDLEQLRSVHETALGDLERSADRIAELEEHLPPERTGTTGPDPAPAAAETRLTDDQLMGRIMELGSKLQQLIVSGETEELKQAMRDILAAGGPGTLDRILDLYREAEGIGPKSVLAHAIAQTGDPAALDALKAIVRDPDASMFDRRTASHGLAFSDDENLEPFYREIANDLQVELGARANIAYGLARRTDEGIELYGRTVDEAFAKKDPLAVGYLSGFMLLGKRSVPAVEARLRTIEETQARLLMIQHLSEHGSANSIPVLREIAADSAAGKDVRDAAEKAAVKLAQPD